MALRGVSSPLSIPLSPNYLDVLYEEEEASLEETPLMAMESEFPGMERAMALSLNPNRKAPVMQQNL
jgi:hypothetical protein